MSKTTLGLRWRSHSAFILSTVAIGQFTDLLLYSIVLPVLPFLLQRRLQLDPENVQSHVSVLLACFSGASLIFSIPAGWLADLGPTRRTPYMVGLVILMLATVMFAVAQNFWLLVVSRISQGFSAAIVNATGLAMVVDTVGSKRLGTTLGTLHSFIAVGELGSPFLGGVLYKYSGYSGVFGVSVAALTIDFVMRALLVETKKTNSHQQEEQVERRRSEHYEPTEVDALLRDQKSTQRNSPNVTRYLPIFQCLRDTRLLVALLLAFVQALIIGTYDATLTTEAASLFAFTSLESGILFLCLGLPNLILAPVAGVAVDRFGVRAVATTGFAFLVPSLALLRLPGHHLLSQDQNVLVFYGLLMINGAWLSVASAPGIVAATRAVEEFVAKDPGCFGPNGPYGQLFGLNWLIFNVGLSVGTVLGGALRNTIGYGNMYAFVAGTSAIAAVTAFSYLKDESDPRKTSVRAEELLT